MYFIYFKMIDRFEISFLSNISISPIVKTLIEALFIKTSQFSRCRADNPARQWRMPSEVRLTDTTKLHTGRARLPHDNERSHWFSRALRPDFFQLLWRRAISRCWAGSPPESLCPYMSMTYAKESAIDWHHKLHTWSGMEIISRVIVRFLAHLSGI